jgi:TetR/AcrR family transcriptional repressor of bet genes
LAEGTASMIDGVWIRQALSDAKTDRQRGHRLVEDYVETQIAAVTAQRRDSVTRTGDLS